MVGTEEWQGRTGSNWAEEWRRTDRSFAPLTERLLQRSREFDFTCALDVGCGAGELSLAVARGRPRVQVAGVDISPALVEAARQRGANLGNVEFVCADAAEWTPREGFVPDLLMSRHGVMFFDAPTHAFTRLAELSAPGAGLIFSCFRDRTESPFFTEVARVSVKPLPHPAEGEPGPFAFADRGRVEWMLGAAGWANVAFEPFDLAMVVGAGADPVADAVDYWTRIGPAARMLDDRSADERARLLDRLRAVAERHMHDQIVSLRAATWIVTARKR